MKKKLTVSKRAMQTSLKIEYPPSTSLTQKIGFWSFWVRQDKRKTQMEQKMTALYPMDKRSYSTELFISRSE